MEPKKRDTFSSGLAIFFATLGSAVGLGNIWKFPYLAGNNGGGAFVFLYLLCVLVVGIPVMVAEFYIGRHSRKNAVGAFEALRASKYWKAIGYLGLASSLFVMFFYSSVAGWVYAYVYKSLCGIFAPLADFPADSAAKISSSIFDKTLAGYSPILWQFLVMAVVAVILLGGIRKGIERATKSMMPVLFILIIICDIRALTLPETTQGLSFLFKVNFSVINGQTLLAALGLAFFKLSLGMGCMITYSSYFTKEESLPLTATKVALSDTLVSLLAGIPIC